MDPDEAFEDDPCEQCETTLYYLVDGLAVCSNGHEQSVQPLHDKPLLTTTTAESNLEGNLPDRQCRRRRPAGTSREKEDREAKGKSIQE